MNVQLMHVYREENQLADLITNEAFKIEGKQIYLNFQQLPNKGKRILNLDKHQVPAIKIRTKAIQ